MLCAFISYFLCQFLWPAECCCDNIDENDENHHDTNADVYADEEYV